MMKAVRGGSNRSSPRPDSSGLDKKGSCSALIWVAVGPLRRVWLIWLRKFAIVMGIIIVLSYVYQWWSRAPEAQGEPLAPAMRWARQGFL